MRTKIQLRCLLAGACLVSGMSIFAHGQVTAPESQREISIAVNYDAATANLVGGSGFSLQGGSAQVEGQFWRGWGVVADVSGLHSGKLGSSTVGLDLLAATFGPRYKRNLGSSRVEAFGEALGGEAWGRNSIFPTGSGAVSRASSVALEVGGGMNVRLSGHVAVRAVQADWLRTEMPNATTDVQNNLRLGAGLVIHSR